MVTAAQLSVPHGALLHLASGSGVTDQSAYQRSGISYQGNVTVSGGAFDFPGNTGDYIDGLGSVSDSALTLAAWVKVPDFGTHGRAIFGLQGSLLDNYMIGASTSNRWFFGWGATHLQTGAATNTWTHLAITLDGSNFRCYVNGVLVHTGAQTVKGSQTLRIGVRNNGTTFKGQADNLIHWDYTATEAEILTLYNAGRQPNYTHPKFDRPRNIPGTVLALRGETGAIDQSDYNQTGVEYAGDTYADATGLHFDGTGDYVNAGGLPENAEALTVAGWVTTTDTLVKVIAGRYNSATADRGWWMGIPDNNSTWGSPTGDELAVIISQDGGFTNKKLYVGSTAIADGNPHHVAFTWDSGTLKLYVDGAEETVTKADDDSFTDIYAATEPVTIGAVNTSTTPTNDITAVIDDIRIINRVLSAGEIANLAAGGSGDGEAPDDTDLVLKLDPADYSGTGNLLDGSGNSNDVTIGANAAIEKGVWTNSGPGPHGTIGSFTLPDSQDCTFSCWYRKTGADSNIILLSNDTTSSRFLLAAQTSSTAAFVGAVSVESLHIDGVDVTATVTNRQELYAVLDADTDWHHIALAFTTVSGWDSGGVEIGGYAFSSTYDSIADLTKIRLYNTHLTPAQIRDLYYEDRPLYQPVGLLGGEVAAWRPDRWVGHGDLLDETGGGYDGTLVDGATVTGDVLSLDGSTGYMQSDYNFPASTDLTVALWVKLDASTTTLMSPFGSNANISRSPYVTIRLNSDSVANRIMAFVYDNTNASGMTYDGADLTTWTHIALTATETGDEVLYVDGVERGRNTLDGTYQNVTGGSEIYKTVIGANRNHSTRYVDGEMDDIRIFTRTLDSAEIKALASARPFDTPNTLGSSLFLSPSTQHAWGSGEDVAVDLSGSANNGTLTNMDPATDWVEDTDSDGVAALDFDGDNDVIVMDDNISYDRDFTWVACCKPTASSQIQAVFSHRDNSGSPNDDIILDLRTSPDYLTPNIFIRGGGTTLASQAASNPVAADAWVAFAVRRNSTVLDCWQDASQIIEVTGASGSAVPAPDAVPIIGSGNYFVTSSTIEEMDGQIDCVLCYTRPLTDEQIALWAQSRSPFADAIIVNQNQTITNRLRRLSKGGVL